MSKRGGFCLALCLFLPLASIAASAETDDWPQRVLLTNDNGIEDVPLIELARALSQHAKVTVVAAMEDRSGTTNFMPSVREGGFVVERRDLGEGITAYALDGYPSDCVLFAVAGPMRDAPPDLVISGINGGPNVADEWFGSGTIGAARAAAYFGLPAIAVSGVEDDDPAAVKAVVDWVVRLALSDVVRDLEPQQYLTVSLPEDATAIQGVAVVPRARGLMGGRARPAEGHDPDGRHRWELELTFHPERAPASSDVAAMAGGQIAVVPMRADENDHALRARLKSAVFPEWVPPVPVEEDPSACRPGFGAYIDDAEDAKGREWGVLITEVLPGGRAEEMGLLAGDVIVVLEGRELVTPRGSREDPVDLLVEILTALTCDGQTVTLEYVRDGTRYEASFSMPRRD